MKRFKNIVTLLSLYDSDAGLLEWTTLLVQLTGASRGTFAHIRAPLDLPEEIRLKYPWLLGPEERILRQKMGGLLDEYFFAHGVTVETRLLLGNPLGEAIALLESNDADLVIAGCSSTDSIFVEKLARKAPCSILAVPEGSLKACPRILAGIDFSDFSSAGLDVGAAFAAAAGVPLTLFHAHCPVVPNNLVNELITQYPSNVRAYYLQQLSILGQPLSTRGVALEYAVVEARRAAAALADYALQGGYGLVTIGCRGRNAIYATLLGSTAEAIFRICKIPVLAIKNKGSARTLLEHMRHEN